MPYGAQLFEHSLKSSQITLEGLFSKEGINIFNILHRSINNPFWKECLKAASSLMQEISKNSPEVIFTCSIWDSSFFTKNGKPLKRKNNYLSNHFNYPIDLVERGIDGKYNLIFLMD